MLQSHLLDLRESNDNVRDLNPGVVNIILNFDLFAGGVKNAHKGVAQHRVPNVTNVRGLVRVDAGVLNHLFCWFCSQSFERLSPGGEKVEESRSVEKDVYVTRPGNFNTLNFRDVFQDRL